MMMMMFIDFINWCNQFTLPHHSTSQFENGYISITRLFGFTFTFESLITHKAFSNLPETFSRVS